MSILIVSQSNDAGKTTLAWLLANLSDLRPAVVQVESINAFLVINHSERVTSTNVKGISLALASSDALVDCGTSALPSLFKALAEDPLLAIDIDKVIIPTLCDFHSLKETVDFIEKLKAHGINPDVISVVLSKVELPLEGNVSKEQFDQEIEYAASAFASSGIPVDKGLIFPKKKFLAELHHLPNYVDGEYLSCVDVKDTLASIKSGKSEDPLLDRMLISVALSLHNIKPYTEKLLNAAGLGN